MKRFVLPALLALLCSGCAGLSIANGILGLPVGLIAKPSQGTASDAVRTVKPDAQSTINGTPGTADTEAGTAVDAVRTVRPTQTPPQP